MSDYQPRYIAYAQAHGKTPEEMLAKDGDLWPGGKMTGYITWINERWAEWDRGHAQNRGGFLREWIRTEIEHDEFTAWLLSRYPECTPEET